MAEIGIGINAKGPRVEGKRPIQQPKRSDLSLGSDKVEWSSSLRTAQSFWHDEQAFQAKEAHVRQLEERLSKSSISVGDGMPVQPISRSQLESSKFGDNTQLLRSQPKPSRNSAANTFKKESDMRLGDPKQQQSFVSTMHSHIDGAKEPKRWHGEEISFLPRPERYDFNTGRAKPAEASYEAFDRPSIKKSINLSPNRRVSESYNLITGQPTVPISRPPPPSLQLSSKQSSGVSGSAVGIIMSNTASFGEGSAPRPPSRTPTYLNSGYLSSK